MLFGGDDNDNDNGGDDGPLASYLNCVLLMRRGCRALLFPVTAGKRSRHASHHVTAGIANQRFPLKSMTEFIILKYSARQFHTKIHCPPIV